MASQMRELLQCVVGLDLTGFPEPDRRVLEACQRRLVAQVIQLARTFQEEPPTMLTPEPAEASRRASRPRLARSRVHSACPTPGRMSPSPDTDSSWLCRVRASPSRDFPP